MGEPRETDGPAPPGWRGLYLDVAFQTPDGAEEVRPVLVLPRLGDAVALGGRTFLVVSVVHDFDNNQLRVGLS